MTRATLALMAAGLGLAACAPVPVDPLRVAQECEQRARRAQGPTGAIALGASTSDGPFVDSSITLSSDYLTGRDPMQVYESCVIERTGAPPVRPPAL